MAESTTVIDTTTPATPAEPTSLAQYQQERAERRGEVPPALPGPVAEQRSEPAPEPPPPVAAKSAAVDKDDEPVVISKRQQYINELIRKQTQAEMRAEQFERELAELKKPREAKPAEPTTPRFEAWDAWQAAHPDRSFEDYLDARDDFRYTQRKTAEEQAAAHARASQQWNEAATTYNSRADAVRARVPDFDEVVARPLPTPLTPPMYDFLQTSPVGPELAYHLASHPEDYTRIGAMPVTRMYAELAKLESTVAPSAPKPVSAAPAVTRAPAPIVPTAHGTLSSPQSLEDLAPTASLAAWKAARARTGG